MPKPTKSAQLLKDFFAAYRQPIQGDYLAKVAFHKLAKRVCKQIVADIGLPADSVNIRTNLAGDGVGGDTTLHTDHFYLNFSAEKMAPLEILYRSCKGPKDFSGGCNNWLTYREMEADYELFLTKIMMVGVIS